MSGADRARASRASGFTLLELLVALAIAAILTAALPGLLRPGAGGLDAAVGLVAAELRGARESAIASGVERGVTFDVEARGVSREGAPATMLPHGVEIAIETAAEARAVLGAPGVLFFPEGGATGGVIALRRGDATARIEVRWLTGAVHVR